MVGPNITKRMPKKRKKPDLTGEEQILSLLKDTRRRIQKMTAGITTKRAVERQEKRPRSPSPRKIGGLIKPTSRKPKSKRIK